MEIKKVHDIPLDEIDISEINVRSAENASTGIDELADSIRLQGLMQPVVLRGEFGKPPYDLIIGQRRYLAHVHLGEETITAVFSGKLNNTEALIYSLMENMHRRDLNHADTAEAITALFKKYKDVNKVHRITGLANRTIYDYIKIEEQATHKAKKYLKENKINRADLKRIIEIAQGHIKKADALLDHLSKLTKYEKDRAVKYGKDNPTATVNEILEDAKKAKIEETIVLNLTHDITTSLRKATKDLAMDKEALAMQALEGWLTSNGYLNA